MADTPAEPGLARILEYLRTTRGFDFTAYKPTTLLRRLQKRMQTVNIDGFDDYLDYLEVHPDEFAALFNTILINVTSFLRDPEVWEALQAAILPGLIGGTRPLRVWSAGCASGQEAYTAAMLLSEAMGEEAFRERVKIYATDVDEEALGEARRAIYTAKQVAEVPPPLAGKYFERNGGELLTVGRELRRAVIFGRHDLIQDAPISRVDLLLCRNTLMYFNAEAQARIMAKLAFSVSQGGYLVLGRAEMLFSQAAAFQPIDLKHRVFKTTARAAARARLTGMVAAADDAGLQVAANALLREAAFDLSPGAQIVVDPDGLLVAANAAARRHFGVVEANLGTPLRDLQISYRPTELRTLIDRARLERRETVQRNVPWDDNGTMRFLDVVVVPLYDIDRGQLLGVRVNFIDITRLRTLQDELTQSKQELETAYEELQSTNEELETTNEELQSTVEELETTNEELQSTNEELETMNEELQSTNEELQTMNDELRNRSLELNSSNAYLESVFTSLRSAVVVLDRDLQVHVWNAGALDMWGVRAEEAQHNSLFNLDIGIPVGELHQPIREILSGAAAQRELIVPATNRRGKPFRCRVALSPLTDIDKRVTGVILLMEDEATVA